MKLRSEVYCCVECKKIIEDIQSILFVEDNSQRGFCSEDCIEDFYRPMVKYYDSEVTRIREKLNVLDEKLDNDESIDAIYDENFYVEELSQSADEIWCVANELREETFYYIKYRRFFMTVMICTQFNETPSFIFCLIKTKSQKLINEFRVGVKLDISQKETHTSQEIEENSEFLTMLENKKSSLLGELLSEWKNTDIPIEEFQNFDKAFNDTLSNPDEIYEIKDREGDLNFNYLKSFMDENIGNYFYVIVCLKVSHEKGETNVFPIMSFPTIDSNLFMKFRIGKKTLSLLSN